MTQPCNGQCSLSSTVWKYSDLKLEKASQANGQSCRQCDYLWLIKKDHLHVYTGNWATFRGLTLRLPTWATQEQQRTPKIDRDPALNSPCQDPAGSSWWLLKSLSWWSQSSADYPEGTHSKPCPVLITPGGWVNAWLKAEQIVYTGISVTSMCCYSIEFLVFFLLLILIFAVAFLDYVPRGLENSEKGCLCSFLSCSYWTKYSLTV